jgi:hypothetical protein
VIAKEPAAAPAKATEDNENIGKYAEMLKA